tara:strand:- start:44 stop:556 length:513 start_codon:yes stop_codon:yes gene_type:complete
VYQNKVYIVLGTNVGNWKNNFKQSLLLLNSLGTINNFSSIYLSRPYGYQYQKYFYNMAIELLTKKDPYKLINDLKLIEKKLKKNKIIKNGPRTIDIDIIFYNNLIFNKIFLTIPHPRAHLRDFVLYPICDICPFYIHPILKKTIKELKNNLKEKFIFKKINRQKENILIF